ncbi:hypothetical protein Nepgr_014629 [Nepenthes gracilis]|uniref:Uncharacterized protein n=1 Tax=Nepenthes gracilis TaxID=150966 RepID=A0AAD3SKC7_NEPGR|nr:hypothetical protein Nepgr_014629 [Nepenthes gracilis]
MAANHLDKSGQKRPSEDTSPAQNKITTIASTLNEEGSQDPPHWGHNKVASVWLRPPSSCGVLAHRSSIETSQASRSAIPPPSWSAPLLRSLKVVFDGCTNLIPRPRSPRRSQGFFHLVIMVC